MADLTGLTRGWEVTSLTAVPVHFHGYKVGKTRVTGCLERGIKSEFVSCNTTNVYP